MRAAALLLLLLPLSPLRAQDAPSVMLVPRWKVGDERKAHLSQVTDTKVNGKASQEREETDLVLRVVNDDPGHFILRVQMDNFVWREAKKASTTVGDELAGWKTLTLRYAVGKVDGRARLVNWADARKFVDGSYNACTKHLAAKDPKAQTAFLEKVTPKLELFRDSSGVEAYFFDLVSYTTFPYGRTLTLGDSLLTMERYPLPYLGDSVKTRTMARLLALDATARTCTISADQRLDAEEIRKLVRAKMLAMAGPLAQDPAERKKLEAQINAEIKNMDLQVRNKVTYTVDMRSTWPLTVEATSQALEKKAGTVKETVGTSKVTFTP